MVAKVICGKSIRKALYYNENKVGPKDAILLGSGGFLRDVQTLSFSQKLERFTDLTRLNERTKTNAMHISLNFSNRDKLDPDKLRSIATDYLEQIGWGEQPYLLYQHFDAAHPHLHIVTTNINRYGERMETHNIGKNQSERARKAIEERYALIKAEEQKKEAYLHLQPINLEKVVYGKRPTKVAISQVVREVVASYKFASLIEFNGILAQFGVYADRGNEDSLMYQKGGLQYRLIDNDGKKCGVPIKASSIYTSPTLENLQKLFLQNKAERKPYGERIKHFLSRIISTAPSLEAFQAQLREKGIRMLLYRGEGGSVYGLSFIDNATRCIFKGSELGKDFSAAAVMKQLEKISNAPFPPDTIQSPSFESGQALAHYPAQSEPIFMQLWTLATNDEHTASTPATLKKKRKIQGLQ